MLIIEIALGIVLGVVLLWALPYLLMAALGLLVVAALAIGIAFLASNHSRSTQTVSSPAAVEHRPHAPRKYIHVSGVPILVPDPPYTDVHQACADAAATIDPEPPNHVWPPADAVSIVPIIQADGSYKFYKCTNPPQLFSHIGDFFDLPFSPIQAATTK
jgi:hypothetical protein